MLHNLDETGGTGDQVLCTLLFDLRQYTGLQRGARTLCNRRLQWQVEPKSIKRCRGLRKLPRQDHFQQVAGAQQAAGRQQRGSTTLRCVSDGHSWKEHQETKIVVVSSLPVHRCRLGSADADTSPPGSCSYGAHLQMHVWATWAGRPRQTPPTTESVPRWSCHVHLKVSSTCPECPQHICPA